MDLRGLRAFRQRAVLSQEELARKSGVARDTISKLETGQRGAYPTTVRKLAAGLGVEPRLLLGGVGYSDELPEHQAAEPPDESTKDRKIGF